MCWQFGCCWPVVFTSLFDSYWLLVVADQVWKAAWDRDEMTDSTSVFIGKRDELTNSASVFIFENAMKRNRDKRKKDRRPCRLNPEKFKLTPYTSQKTVWAQANDWSDIMRFVSSAAEDGFNRERIFIIFVNMKRGCDFVMLVRWGVSSRDYIFSESKLSPNIVRMAFRKTVDIIND